MAIIGGKKNINNYPQVNNSYGAGNGVYSSQYDTRRHLYGNMYRNPNNDLAILEQGIQGMSLHSQSFATQTKNAMMPTSSSNYNGLSVGSVPSAPYGSTGQCTVPNSYGGNNSNNNLQPPNMYALHPSQYLHPIHYQSYPHHASSPLSNGWTPAQSAGDVSTLHTPRRNSGSSNEDDQPATPSYGSYPSFTHGAVAVNRSPSGAFSTPPPTSMMGPYGMPIVKQPEHSAVSPRIKLLVTREPRIPRAIPAPSTPLKPLDRALENQRGETNVYIRGLLPETNDEMLEAWGARFGDIKTSKSIIDLKTGLCKGFGFVKYHNYEDAENCIRGFHHLGYEVSFARESFYSKLKTFADESNTNLYVSCMPKSMNEHELTQLFAPHKVCSCRILRDRNGHGRGVGFARFESRDTCDEIIKSFSNQTIKSAGQEMQVQIRYADTQEQKSLKQQTQAARQFRSAEYEFATQAWRQGRLPYAGSTVPNTSAGNEFERYLKSTINVPNGGQRGTESTARQVPGSSSQGNTPNTDNTQETLATTVVASGADCNVNPPKDAAGTSPAASSLATSSRSTSPATTGINSPVDSAAASEQK